MKFFFNDKSRLCAIGLVTSILAACGGNDSNNNKQPDDHGDHHDHGSLLISQSNNDAISYLDEGTATAFENALTFNGATFVRSDNGEFAALKGGSSIHFTHEEGVLNATIEGIDVVATEGHFSILNAGSSTFLEVESLEDDALETTSTDGLGLTETFPALMLDEEDGVKLLFADNEAAVYEGDVASSVKFACTSPSAVAQAHHAAIVTCEEGVTLLQFEENEMTDSISYETALLELDGTDKSYVWTSTEHVLAGYVPSTSDYALIHIEDHHEEDHSEEDHSEEDHGEEDHGEEGHNEEEHAEAAYELIQPADAHAEAFTGTICEASLESQDGDFLFWLAGGKFIALNSEGTLKNQISVDTSTSQDCADYSLSSAAKVAYVLDNDAMKFYDIDVHEGASSYHLHETLDISVSDITDSVALFHNEAGHGDDDAHGH